MQLDQNVISALINVSAILIAACGATSVWMWFFFPFRLKGRWYYYTFVITKLFLINLLTNVILAYYYAEAVWFHNYYVGINILAVGVGISYIVFVTGKGRIARRFVLFIVGEIYGIFIGAVTIFLVKYLTGSDFMTNGSALVPEYKDNIIVIIIGLMLILITFKWGQPLLQWLHRYSEKHEHIFLGVSFFYVVAGLISILKAGYWSQEMVLSGYYTMISVSVMLMAVYLREQKKSKEQLQLLNKILLLQKELMTDYYLDLETQIRITEDIRSEISGQMETIQFLVKDNESIRELQDYAISLEKQQNVWKFPTYSENKMVNYVLYCKQRLCEKRQIELNVDMQEQSYNEKADRILPDIIYLLVDYMMELCGQSDSERAKIHLKIGHKSENLYVKGRVSASIPDAPGKSMLIMLKRLLNEYDGSMTNINQKDWKEITIFIKN